MNNYIVSHIRTFVPILVGTVVTGLTTWGIDVDTTGWVAAITGASIALYYAIVRAAAERWPMVGIFLGVNQAPSYDR